MSDVATAKKVMDPKDFTKIYLNGEFVEWQSERVYTLKNPKDNTVVSDKFPIADEADVGLPVQSAKEAFRPVEHVHWLTEVSMSQEIGRSTRIQDASDSFA